MAHNAMPK